MGPVTLPRLILDTDDPRAIARVIRGALRLRTETVHLVKPPTAEGQHELEIDVPGEGRITLLAEPAGKPHDGKQPLRVRPLTRVQMAELFALLERLDAPSDTMPPPDDFQEFGGEPHDDDGDTLMDDHTHVLAPPRELPRSERPAAPARASTMAPRARVEDPRIGRVLAKKYRIEAPLGSGAAATVYRALHTELVRPVAIKILHAQNQSEAQFVKRFKAEALAASRLDHVNVTRILDFGQEEGVLYLVMEFVAGQALESLLADEGPLPQARVIDIGIQICRALSFAHDQGIIHRDIKPENVMVVGGKDDDGEACDVVKVCDFGLAKLRDPEAEDLTIGGMLCGSPAYMSPEQTRGDELDPRSDVYALGVTLFEALTGALPHDATSIAELFIKKVSEPPRKPSSLVAEVDPVLEDVLFRAMAIDRRARHASARELRAELAAVLEQLEVDSTPHRTIVGG
jgi:eukaryotic-like serine/threonine-protein kinase